MKNHHAYLLAAALAIPLVILGIPLALRAELTAPPVRNWSFTSGICCKKTVGDQSNHTWQLALRCSVGQTLVENVQNKQACQDLNQSNASVSSTQDGGNAGFHSSMNVVVDRGVCCREKFYDESGKESYRDEMRLGTCSGDVEVDTRHCGGGSVSSTNISRAVCCGVPGIKAVHLDGNCKGRGTELDLKECGGAPGTNLACTLIETEHADLSIRTFGEVDESVKALEKVTYVFRVRYLGNTGGHNGVNDAAVYVQSDMQLVPEESTPGCVTVSDDSSMIRCPAGFLIPGGGNDVRVVLRVKDFTCSDNSSKFPRATLAYIASEKRPDQLPFNNSLLLPTVLDCSPPQTLPNPNTGCTSDTQCGQGKTCMQTCAPCAADNANNCPCFGSCVNAGTPTSCVEQRAAIDRALEDNRSCQTDSDCGVFSQSCNPLITCAAPLRTDKFPQLHSQISAYSAACPEQTPVCAGCAMPGFPACEQGRCVLQAEM